MRNRQWILQSRPEGRFKTSDFNKHEYELPKLKNDEVLLQTLYLSFDPTQRGWAAIDTYLPAVPLGEVMRSIGIGQVIQSNSRKYKVGDIVGGFLGWQEFVIFDVNSQGADFNVLPSFLKIDLTLAMMLTGLTAYFGLFDIGRPKPGETVLVSGAAGATGSIVGQLGKIAGTRVIGIAGSKTKCDWLVNEAGFDGAINYKTDNVAEKIKELCPKGIDVFFDNVGGEILDIALLNLAQNGRIVLCGQISQYEKIGSSNTKEAMQDVYGVRNLAWLLPTRGFIKGFILLDYMTRSVEGLVLLNKWIDEKRLVQAIDMQEGFENIPETLLRIFEGKNLGKQLLKLADPPLPIKTSSAGKFAFKALGAYYALRKGF